MAYLLDNRSIMSDSLSPIFLSACAKLRANDPSVLPERNKSFEIRRGLSETEHIEIAKALTQSTAVRSLRLDLHVLNYSKKAAEAMAEYIRSSIHLHRVYLYLNWNGRSQSERALLQMAFSVLLQALLDSTSVQEIRLNLECWNIGHELAVCKDLTSLLSLPHILKWTRRPTLKTISIKLVIDDLTVHFPLLGSHNSNITELILDGSIRSSTLGSSVPMSGLETVLRTLIRQNTLTNLEMRGIPLSLYQVRLLAMVLRKHKNLQTLVLRKTSLGSAHLAEIATALEQHKSVKTLDLSGNDFDDIDSAVILRNIIHVNESISKVDLSHNSFGRRPEAVRCIAMGLKRSATLLEVNLGGCQLGDRGVSVLAATLFSRDGILQKLFLKDNNMSFTSLRQLVDGMIEHRSQLTDLDLSGNPIGDAEGANFLASTLASNAMSHLTQLCLSRCVLGDDGLAFFVSALETNQALNELDLTRNTFSERGFSLLAMSLPKIQFLKRIHFRWCRGLVSAMPLLLGGLRDNTSVVQFNVTGFGHVNYNTSFPPMDQDAAINDCGWRREMQYLGVRNHFIPMIPACLETTPPLGLWARALAKVSQLPDVLFYALRSKAALVPSGIA